MDEFRKPYEYNEEKRGFLLLFIVMILTVDVFLVVSYTIQSFNALKKIMILAIIAVVLGSLTALCAFITATICYQLNRKLIAVSKAYLAARAVFTAISIIVVYLNNINNQALIGHGPNQYANASELTLLTLVMPMAYTLAFSIIWHQYFLKSKRLRALIKDREGVGSPTGSSARDY